MTKYFELKKYLFIVVILLASLTVGGVKAQDGGDTEVDFFTFASDTPIVERGERGEWDDQYNLPAGAVFYEGTFYLFRTALPSWPAAAHIGLLTSDDGLHWEKSDVEPLISTEDVEFAGTSIFGTSVLQEADGTWTYYFYTRDSGGWPLSSSGQIGRATADELTGPWTVHPEPVLSPGSEESWDERQVLSPNVFITDDGYVMFYGGVNDLSEFKVGRATSEDGIVWVKDEGPILDFDGDWEQAVNQPSVQHTPDGFVMIYKGDNSYGGLGLAISEDGIEWEKYAAKPVLVGEESILETTFDNASLLYHEDTYYLFIEFTSGNGTDLYMASHAGLLRE